ncbi:MAG TPA: amidohydrolase [Bacteroidales bacterium]|nr:amidohydrolase [Bacteroidales bacterium]HQN15580.1 amidohydrolase [Bacteroidales bacterium]HQP15093.1 amidohydrolase [Bacteroidales bacterium]
MKKNVILLTIACFTLMHSCQTQTDADLLLLNGKIYTVDSNFSIAEAMAVKNGKIVATGSTKEISGRFTADSMMDLGGKPVYPGFIDAHSHFYGLALFMQQADLNGAASFEEVVERLQAHYQKYRPPWVLGRGWDQNLWENKAFPDNALLDKNFPDLPVVLTRIDGHAVIANSKALEMAQITDQTNIPGGKTLQKDGKITGVLIDKAADRMKDKIPQPEEKELIALLKEAQQHCLSLGLTTVADAGLQKNTVLLLEKLFADNTLKINIYAMLEPSSENIETFVKKGIYRKGGLHICSLKLYADGALGSRGACLLEPYSDELSNTGLMVETRDSLIHYCRLAYENNYQMCTHAIGDSAVRAMLNIYAAILKGTNDRRWRIEHAQVISPSDIGLFAQFSIIPSVQPTHATSDMLWAADRLGNERVKSAYAYKDLLKQNNWLPFGTDFPIEKADPLLTFYAAVFRKDANSQPTGGFQIENAVSRVEALKGITLWAAKGCFEENEKGSLEAGKYADFVVLDQDIMTISEEKIIATKVLHTFIRGEKMYSCEAR